MRNDLKHCCAACRLRYSTLLPRCPICNAEAMTLDAATRSVQPTSRVAWVAKWLIALSSLAGASVVAWTSSELLKDGWPPKSAMDVLMYPLGAMGAALGAGIVVSIPLAIWIGILKLLQRILARFIDGPRRTLRVAIDRVRRTVDPQKIHPLHRLWNRLVAFVQTHASKSSRLTAPAAALFILAQVVAELFGRNPMFKASTWSELGQSLTVLGMMNVLALVVAGFLLGAMGALIAFTFKFLTGAPPLFGYRASPPDVNNEARIASFLDGREEIIGRAAPLDAQELAALAARFDGQALPTSIEAPLSGKTCLAFRVVGEADGHPVDDADAVCFAVVTRDEKRCVVSSSDFVVLLAADTQGDTIHRPRFFEERGLPKNNLAVDEAVLAAGDWVRVIGRKQSLHIGSAGYRGDQAQRAMMEATDGLPVAILRAEARS